MTKPRTTAAGIRILIADDHEIFRAGLRKLLETQPGFDIVGEAADGAEAASLARTLTPDLVLIDLAMPRLSGLEAIRDIAATSSDCRAVLLTAAIERPQIVEALQHGARGVVMKEAAAGLLFKCVYTVMKGEFWVGRESVADLVQYIRQPLQARPATPRRSFGITPREMQVIATVVAGCPNKEIAQQFSISEDTVKHHLSNIFDKLGVSNRLELALFAINHELVAS
jgi:DNA-binding NarL/FixJ family response regulator